MTQGALLSPEHIAVGLDLAASQHVVVVLDSQGKRLTRFKVSHSINGFGELLRRTQPRAWGARHRVFAFEATGHIWEALAHFLGQANERYRLVNPLATFRLREARTMSREKTDAADAEEIAQMLRTGLTNQTQYCADQYLVLRRLWGEYSRLRYERARLKTLLSHQLHGGFPELLTVWSRIDSPGPLAVLRTGLTPDEIAVLTVPAFLDRVMAERRTRRVWKPKLEIVHRKAQRTVAPAVSQAAMMAEARRIVLRMDLIETQMTEIEVEIRQLLSQLEEAQYVATIPGLGWRTVAGLIAHIGSIDKFRHGRQLAKLAGTNPGRHESGGSSGGVNARMTHRGRAEMRHIVYMATLSSLQHNPRMRAHYDRLISRPDRPLTRMKAMGACMNKLLLYVFAVAKKQQPFDLGHCWERQPRQAA